MAYSRDARIQDEKALIAKWEWLTEDIKDYEKKKMTSIVLQNSYQTMMDEGQIREGWLENLLEGNDDLNESPMTISATGTNLIPKVLFPVIRRVFPQLIANELVSVQPITQRTGVIYYIAYQFSNSKGEIISGDEYSGIGATAMQGPGFATFYTSEKIGPFTATVATGSDTVISTGNKILAFLGTDVSQFRIKRIEAYKASTGAGQATSLDNVSSNVTWSVAGSNVGYNAADGSIVLRNPADNGTNGVNVPWAAGEVVNVYLVYDQEGSSKIPEMEFSIGSKTVETTERKLKVRWTKEAEQDMKAYHSIDVESELVKVASMEMNYEIDREILNFIGNNVQHQLSFEHSWTNDAAISGNNTAGNYLDRHRALAQKIYQVAAKIAQYNRQGPASWAVVSPQIAAVLSMLPSFKGEIAGGSFNIFNAGFLGNGLKLYVDPNRVGTQAGEILLGYKSDNTTYGAGVVYAPYTNWMSNTVTHPDNFNSIRGFFSRYAMTLVPRGQWFYGKLQVNGLDLVD